jgi:hypothetical protein
MITASQTSGRLVWVLASIAVIVALTVSGNLLTDLGSAYITEGGMALEKIHPASYLMIIAGVLQFGCDIVSRATRTQTYARHRALIIYIGGIVFCMVYSLLFSGTGGIIALLDTYLPAGVAAFVLSTTTKARRERLGLIITLLCTANAALAIAEVDCQTNLVPIGPELLGPGSEFRPTALYDHPLTGAAATVLGLLLTAKLRWPNVLIILCRTVLLVGLVCFGERAPLVIGLGTLIFAVLVTTGEQIIHRRPCYRRVAVFVRTALFVSIAITLVLLYGFSDRLAVHSYWDDSAQIRLSQFHVLAWLTPAQLIFGCAREDFIALLEPLRLAYRVGVIENFWLVMLTSLGLLGFPVFVLSLWALLRYLWRSSDGSGRLMIVVLIATASTSNSLGRKSPLLMMLVASVVAASVPGYVRHERGLKMAVRQSRA